MQGRNYSAITIITQIMTQIVTALSQGLAKMVATSRAGATTSPSFYISPISLPSYNLAPVHTSGHNLATYILCVLLWLGTTFIVSSMFPFGAKTEEAVVAVILERGTSTQYRKQVCCSSPSVSAVQCNATQYNDAYT